MSKLLSKFINSTNKSKSILLFRIYRVVDKKETRIDIIVAEKSSVL